MARTSINIVSLVLRVRRVRLRDLSELGRGSVGGKELRAHPRVRTLRVLPEPVIRQRLQLNELNFNSNISLNLVIFKFRQCNSGI